MGSTPLNGFLWGINFILYFFTNSGRSSKIQSSLELNTKSKTDTGSLNACFSSSVRGFPPTALTKAFCSVSSLRLSFFF